ncbi:unnamed protein product [Brassica napus]|uniref:(rape) hypothetical protein n=1 Tax=Brassica napus TaxID=3708 RepID=A0A816IK83_BRANA|nr:unnamed protein product [Brassica napus]
MTKSKPNKKENKSKTSEEPTHRKPQQESGETTFSVLKRTWAVVTGGWSCLGV